MVREFHIFRHPLDGLSLLLESIQPSQAALFWGMPWAPLSLYGWPGFPPDDQGLVGALQGRPLSQLIRSEWGDLPLILPSHAESEIPKAELLDRLQRRLASSFQRLYVALSLERLELDLPCLNPEDRVYCYWETRDILGDAALQRFESLAETVQEGKAKIRGFQLYHRYPSLTPTREAELSKLLKWAGDKPTVRHCKEVPCPTP